MYIKLLKVIPSGKYFFYKWIPFSVIFTLNTACEKNIFSNSR